MRTITSINFSPEEVAFRSFLDSRTKNELIELLLMRQETQIPISIFETDLAPLEAIVKYLKEYKGFSFQYISAKLGRDSKVIWSTYNNALESKKKLVIKNSDYFIPLSFLKKSDSNNASILESTVFYLKSFTGLTYHQIATLLHRDDRTVWTVYMRAEKKYSKNYSQKNSKLKNNILKK